MISKTAADGTMGESLSPQRIINTHMNSEQPSARTMKKSATRVLVVDDNRDAAHSLSMLLRLSGHEVQTAYDGVETISIAQEFRPQLILLDIGLPQINGYAAARAIRAESWGKGMTLVAVTGSDEEEDVQQAMESGFNGHMVKPVEPAALMELLASLQPAD